MHSGRDAGRFQGDRSTLEARRVKETERATAGIGGRQKLAEDKTSTVKKTGKGKLGIEEKEIHRDAASN